MKQGTDFHMEIGGQIEWLEGYPSRRWCYFGSGGGSSAPQATTSTTTQELSPEQRELINLAMPAARQFAAAPPTYFPGQKIAATDPNTLAAQQMALGAAYGPASQIASNAAAGTNFLTSGAVLDPNLNPGLQGSLAAAMRPLDRAYSTQVLPGIRTGAEMAGQRGGTREGIAQGLATQGYMDTAGDISSRIVSNAYGQGLNAMTQGIGMSPQIMGAQYQPATAVSAVGAQREAQSQQQINEEVNKYMYEQMAPFLAAQSVAQLAFGMPGGSATTNTLGPGPQGPSGSQEAMGWGSLAIGLGSLALLAM